MANSTRNIAQSIPSGQMNLDDHPLSFGPGDYGYCLNGSDSHTIHDRILGTANGNFVKSSLPEGFYNLGKAKLSDHRVVMANLNPSTGVGEIGLFYRGKYTTVKSSKKFNFRIDRPIEIEVKGTTIYFTDDYNPMRYLDIENIPLKDGDIDTDKMLVFGNFVIPNIQLSAVEENGALRAGSYVMTMRYVSKRGVGLTRFSTPVGPISIFKDSLNSPFDLINGCPSDVITNKSIKLSLSGVDTAFDLMDIVAIRTINGVKRAFIVGTISTGQTEFVYTGFGNDAIEIGLDEVNLEPVAYDTAKTVSRSSNLLLFGNLTTKKVYNLQPLVSRFTLQWQAYRVPAAQTNQSYKDPVFASTHMGYRSNEVYPLGFVAIWKNGTKSPVYPFVPREKNKTSKGLTILNTQDSLGNNIQPGQWDTQPIDNEDVFETSVPERWQSFNTATLEGNRLQSGTSVFGAAQYGELAYYESTELYPNNTKVWGDLAGKPVRFPKFPDRSLVPLQDIEPTIPNEDKTALYLLGITITNLEEIIAQFPQEVTDQMQGWEIVRADRTFDASVVASGIIQNTRYNNWKNDENEEDDIRLYPNFPLNDLRTDYYTGSYSSSTRTILGGAITVSNSSSTDNKNYKKDVFTFYSPDTQFNKVSLNASELVIEAELYGDADLYFNYVNPYAGLQTQTKNDLDKVVVQGIAIGKYRNSKSPVAGNSRRSLADAFYVPFNSQANGGNIGSRIHNLTRESSVYLRVNSEIADPSIQDTSRGSLNDQDVTPGGSITGFGCKLESFTRQRSLTNKRTTSAYYATLRNFIKNQYGSLSSIRWIYTGNNHYNTTSESIIFGGDTFVTAHTLKRQLVFFQNAQAYKDKPEFDEYDLKNSETLRFTQWWSLFINDSRPETKLMCFNNRGSEDGGGYLPLIYTGIPIFYVESNVNTALRHNGESEWETFYNNLQENSITLEQWTGIEHTNRDNDFRYNSDFSDQNNLFFYENLPLGYDPDEPLEDFPTRVIASLPSDPEQLYDNWLVFRPLDYYDLPENSKELWSIRYLGGHKTMFRCSNHTYIDSVYSELTTNDTQLLLGSGRLFQRKPIEIIESEDGYSGTHSQWAFDSTPFGHFFIDPVNGAIFNYGDGIKSITVGSKVYKWMRQNLPLKFKQQFPDFENYDNPQSPQGIGYISVYDPITDYWILTKRDYSLIDPLDIGRITFEGHQILFDNRPINLSDETIFKNESFTIGYNCLKNKWISFYSFIPMAYIQDRHSFLSMAIGDSRLYEHKDNLRTYYGKVCPFIVDMIHGTSPLASYISEGITFHTRAYGKENAEDYYTTFDKAIVYNDIQCSGITDLEVVDENNLQSVYSAWMRSPEKMKLELRRNADSWSMSGFYNRVKDHNEAFFSSEWKWTKYSFPIDKVLVSGNINIQRDYREDADFLGFWLTTRMIQDKMDTSKKLYVFFSHARNKYSGE